MLQETIRKMRSLKLTYMAEKLEEMSRTEQFHKLEKDDILAMIVDREFQCRRENRITRFMREAQIRFPSAGLEDIDYRDRRLQKSVIRDLASCLYLEHFQNVLISGATGSGKTFLASALGAHSCRNLFRVRYRRISKLLEEIKQEKAAGDYLKILEKVGRYNLLILDDLGPDVLGRQERSIIMDIVEERYMKGSILVASQLPFDQWYDVFGDPATADAICDRLFHNAIKIDMQGAESMRKRINSTINN